MKNPMAWWRAKPKLQRLILILNAQWTVGALIIIIVLNNFFLAMGFSLIISALMNVVMALFEDFMTSVIMRFDLTKKETQDETTH